MESTFKFWDLICIMFTNISLKYVYYKTTDVHSKCTFILF